MNNARLQFNLYRLPIVFSVFVLIISAFYFVYSFSHSYIGISLKNDNEQWVVESVDPYGIGNELGIAPGDIPLIIDGLPADQYLSAFKDSGWIRVVRQITVVNPNGTILDADSSLTQPTSTATIDLVMWLLPCLAFWVVGIYVYLRNPKNEASVLLLACGLVFGLALSSNMASDRLAPLALHITVVASTIGPWLLLHFFLILPQERAWLRHKPYQYLVYVLPALIVIAYPFIGQSNGQPLPDFRTFRLIGYGVGFLGVIGVVVFNLLRAADSRTRQQMVIILLGCMAALLPFLVFSVFPGVQDDSVFLQSNITVAFLSFIPLSLGYAVIARQLMNIDVVVRRGVVYGLITLSMAAVLAGVFALVLSGGVAPGFTQQFILALFLSAIAVLLLGPARSATEALVDKFFYKDRHDYQQIIQTLSASLSATASVEVASSLIIDAPMTSMNLSGACLFVATDETSFVFAAARGVYADRAFEFELMDFVKRRTPSTEYPNVVGSKDVAYMIPLTAAGKTVGVLFLSDKASRQEFSNSDHFLIRSLTSVAAVSLRGLLIAERDILERRKNDQAILIAKQEWESTFDSIPDLICILDKDHNIIRVNRSMADKTGMLPAEAVGKKCYQIMHDTCVLPGFCPGLGDRNRCGLGDEIVQGDNTYQVNITPIKIGGKSSGRYVHIARDITAIKKAEAEQQRLKEKAELSSRLAAVGEMAAGIAHEINNPLTGVLGFSELLLARSDLAPEVADDLKVIVDGSRRVAEIVKRMLTFAHQTKPLKSRVDITELIDNTLELRAYVLKTAGIEVVKNYSENLPWIIVDPGQMQQVILNLIVNAEYAIKHSGKPGKLTITAALEGKYLRLVFADSGPGIDNITVTKIFQPFFTTKNPGEGTGLGLSLSRSIVEEHGGTLEVESSPGCGAAFTILLPIVQSSGAAAETRDPSVINLGHQSAAVILVIDDEECIRNLAVESLSGEGRHIDTAASAAQALILLSKKDYDVIVMDLRLPGTSGMALYTEIIDRRPEMTGRIVIITGDTLGEDVKMFLEKHRLPSLVKPFEPAALALAVSQTLNDVKGRI
ncbi:PAS domain S-box [Dehalogenimonas alkenigignens]|uniref:histidine kinase n=1 Tax=Dehalogenimonas alkenigignens TaxID=1217799 RepID=A0A0W0GJ13_9CHLR|nr:ATP-binding protein [Dehalogenimonas alkenigignens]KTB48555.1 PAS domain S-box [Dehalogenimonas alkenigignens]